MHAEEDETALAERLAARFAILHPETARRLRARAEVYCHRPLGATRPPATPEEAPGGGYGAPATNGTRS